MKKTAFMISCSLYSNYFGSEAWDISLALSLINEETGFFFVGDGIFQILKNKNIRNDLPIKNDLNILKAYGITKFYSSINFFRQRGIKITHPLLIHVLILDECAFRKKLDSFDFILKL